MLILILLISCNKKPEPEKPITHSLFFQPSETIMYDIRDFNNNNIYQGDGSDDYYTEISGLQDNVSFRIYYWNKERYIEYQTRKQIKQDYYLDIEPSMKKGNMSIDTGKLIEGNMRVRFNTDGYIMNPKVCFVHSLTILRINLDRQTERCSQFWRNISQTTYLCGDKNRDCTNATGNICYLKVYDRTREYDKCVELPSLNNETYTLDINVQTIGQLKDDDFLDILLYDSERSSSRLINGVWAYSIIEEPMSKKRVEV